jgi:hypothetical protein
VPSRVLQLFYKGKLRQMKTKRMRILPSQIPALVGKSNSWGVFTDEKVKAGDFIGLYGGVIEERDYAELLRLPEFLLASHMKDVAGKWTGHLLDGIINDIRGMDWYASQTLIGSVFNCGYLEDNVNTHEEVVPAGLLGFEHPHARTGKMTRVTELMCYFAKEDMDEGVECLVNLGPDHRGSYFVPAVADRLVLPPYPPRPPVRVNGEYDVRSAQSIRDAADSRQARFQARFTRCGIEDAPSPAAAPFVAAPDYSRRTRTGASGGVGAGAAPPPLPASAIAAAGLPGVEDGIGAVEDGIEAVELGIGAAEDGSAAAEGGLNDGGWIRRSSRTAPSDRVRFADDNSISVTVKRNRDQYERVLLESQAASSKTHAETKHDYIQDIITLQINEAAQNHEIEVLRSVIHDAQNGDNDGGDVGWDLSHLAEVTRKLSIREYKMRREEDREAKSLKKQITRRNERIEQLQDERKSVHEMRSVKSLRSVKLWRAQSTLNRVRGDVVDLKAQEDEEDEEEYVMVQVAKEAAARSSASAPEGALDALSAVAGMKRKHAADGKEGGNGGGEGVSESAAIEMEVAEGKRAKQQKAEPAVCLTTSKTHAFYMQREDKGRYSSHYRMLWYDLAARISIR